MHYKLQYNIIKEHFWKKNGRFVYYTYIKFEIIILYNTLLSWHHFGVVSVSRMVSDNLISNKYLKCVYYFRYTYDYIDIIKSMWHNFAGVTFLAYVH